MESQEIAKEILVALIDKSGAFGQYKSEDKLMPAKTAGEAYKIILKAVSEADKEYCSAKDD